jgi:hypothetical protein
VPLQNEGAGTSSPATPGEGSETIIVNNFFYNCGSWSRVGDSDNSGFKVTVEGNEYVKGSVSSGTIRGLSIVNTDQVGLGPEDVDYVYVEDNRWDGNWYNSSLGNAFDFVYVYSPATYVQSASPIPSYPIGDGTINILSSSSVESHTTSNAGAWPVARDSVDSTLISEIASRTDGGYANCVANSSAGAWPVLTPNVVSLNIPANMHSDDDADGYTNLEEFIHTLSCQAEGLGSPSCLSVPSPECSDGADNDGDTLIDFPDDPGCSSLTDDDETDPVQLCSPADSNGDDVVDMVELMTYISEWKAGTVTMVELMFAISEWKNGC